MYRKQWIGMVLVYLACAAVLAVLDIPFQKAENCILLGIPSEAGWERIGEWLLLLFPVLVRSGMRYEFQEKMHTLILHRYGTWLRWFIRMTVQNLVDCMIYTCILELVFYSCGISFPFLWVWLVLTLHEMFLIQMICFIKQFADSIKDTVIFVLLAYGVSLFFLIRGNSVSWPCFWGMWVRLGVRRDILFATLILESMCCAACTILVWVSLRGDRQWIKKGLFCKKFRNLSREK